MFQLPEIKYFQFKNYFAGSLGEFNYKLIPDGEVLKVSVWYGAYCMEKSEIAAQTEFPLTLQGLMDAESWLKQQFEERK